MRFLTIAAALLLAAAPAAAQSPAVKFSLDWILQGQQAPFLLGQEKGYYAADGVNLAAVDAGRGSSDTIGRIANGVYEIGFGDLSSLIEFNAKNPGKEMIAVAMIYDQAPFAIVSLKKHGISKPADLKGKKGASPSFDSTYRLFNVFAKVNGLDPASMTWANVAPQLREPMLARGETEAIAALKAREPLTNEGVELQRLTMAFEFIATENTKRNGLGDVDPARLQKNIDLVTEGFQLPRKIPAELVFDRSYLAPAAERRIGG